MNKKSDGLKNELKLIKKYHQLKQVDFSYFGEKRLKFYFASDGTLTIPSTQ